MFRENHPDRGNLIDRMKMCVRCQQRYSVKGHGVYIPGFVGETVSVTATQLCPWSVKALLDSTQMNKQAVFR